MKKLTERLQLGNIYITTMQAEKRWRHGRLEQLACRLFCQTFGHAWMRWRWEWSREEVTEMDMPDGWSPPKDEVLVWFRGCHRVCGVMQTALARYDQKEELP